MKVKFRSPAPGRLGDKLVAEEFIEALDRVETEETAVLGHIGQQIVRRAVADGAGRSGRLVDVLVVEHGLRSPSGLLVEIMLPADAADVAPIVASQGGLLGSLGDRGACEAVGEKIDRCAAGRCVDGINAPALKGIVHELIK